jgi:hypothetical protein
MSAQDPIIGKRVGGYRVTSFIAHGSYGPTPHYVFPMHYST